MTASVVAQLFYKVKYERLRNEPLAVYGFIKLKHTVETTTKLHVIYRTMPKKFKIV